MKNDEFEFMKIETQKFDKILSNISEINTLTIILNNLLSDNYDYIPMEQVCVLASTIQDNTLALKEYAMAIPYDFLIKN